MVIEVENSILLGEVKSVLESGRDARLMTKGRSMNPFIVGGRDSVILRKFPESALKRGDVVLAEVKKDFYVLHRILKIDGDAVTLAGDGNIDLFEHCTRADIIGTVTRIERSSGRSARPCRAAVWQRLPNRVRWFFLKGFRRLKDIH